MYTKDRAVSDYRAELSFAIDCKAAGYKFISCWANYPPLAKGRTEVPVDEVITFLSERLEQLEQLDTDDASAFNY